MRRIERFSPIYDASRLDDAAKKAENAASADERDPGRAQSQGLRPGRAQSLDIYRGDEAGAGTAGGGDAKVAERLANSLAVTTDILPPGSLLRSRASGRRQTSSRGSCRRQYGCAGRPARPVPRRG